MGWWTGHGFSLFHFYFHFHFSLFNYSSHCFDQTMVSVEKKMGWSAGHGFSLCRHSVFQTCSASKESQYIYNKRGRIMISSQVLFFIIETKIEHIVSFLTLIEANIWVIHADFYPQQLLDIEHANKTLRWFAPQYWLQSAFSNRTWMMSSMFFEKDTNDEIYVFSKIVFVGDFVVEAKFWLW